MSVKELLTLSVGGDQSTSNYVHIFCLTKTNIMKKPWWL